MVMLYRISIDHSKHLSNLENVLPNLCCTSICNNAPETIQPYTMAVCLDRHGRFVNCLIRKSPQCTSGRYNNRRRKCWLAWKTHRLVWNHLHVSRLILPWCLSCARGGLSLGRWRLRTIVRDGMGRRLGIIIDIDLISPSLALPMPIRRESMRERQNWRHLHCNTTDASITNTYLLRFCIRIVMCCI